MNRGDESESCQEKSKTDAKGDTGGRGDPTPSEACRPGAALFFQGRTQTVPNECWRLEVEIRSEYAQLLAAVFLFVAGSGPWSVDAFLVGKRLSGSSGRHADESYAAIEQPLAMAVHSNDSWTGHGHQVFRGELRP